MEEALKKINKLEGVENTDPEIFNFGQKTPVKMEEKSLANAELFKAVEEHPDIAIEDLKVILRDPAKKTYDDIEQSNNNAFSKKVLGEPMPLEEAIKEEDKGKEEQIDLDLKEAIKEKDEVVKKMKKINPETVKKIVIAGAIASIVSVLIVAIVVIVKYEKNQKLL